MNQGNIVKLKKEKVEIWKAWALFLSQRQQDVVATLREENILYEGSLLFEIAGDWYVCLFAVNEKDAIKGPNLDNELNIQHRQKMKECFEEKIGPASMLYLFDARI